MRDNNNRLARGKFNFEDNKLIVEEGVVTRDAELGVTTSSSFIIKAEREARGLVYSSDLRVHIIDNEFAGKQNEIRFTVDGRGLKKKDILEGKFTIISDYGEIELPFHFKCVPRFVNTSIGEASNLFHFTNVYQRNSKEALDIFFSPDFKEIFLDNDSKSCNLYDVIKNKEHGLESIEEFLISLKKKRTIEFKLEKNGQIYENLKADIKDSFFIRKNEWGSLKLQISCNDDFIILSKNVITEEDFTGDLCEIEYIIDCSKLHRGKNYTKIKVTAFNVDLEYEIECNKEVSEAKKEQRIISRAKKDAYRQLVMEYLDYRMNLTRKDIFVGHVREILHDCNKYCSDDLFLKLALAQSFLMTREYEEGSKIIEEVKIKALASINSDPVIYCYYLYINSLYIRSGDYTEKVIKQVTQIYESGAKSWRILWILFYLNTDNEKNRSIRLIRLKEIIKKGCTSPVMYYEALKIFNFHPELFRVVDDFELKVVNFGIRHNAIHEGLAKQIASVIDELKYASNEQIEILKYLYSVHDFDEILCPLVKHLVRAGLDENENNKYFELAILKGFKITRIYEYYISSCNKSLDIRFPKLVLMYFLYDNNMQREDKAFLYGNIVYNKEFYKEEYNWYLQIIENFAKEMLKIGFVNEHMSIIYNEFLTDELINEANCDFVSQLKFIHKIKVDDDKIVGAIVKLKEKTNADFYEIKNKECYIPIYTDDCAIAFLCNDGVIRKEGFLYTVTQLMPDIIKDEQLRNYEISNEGFMINWALVCHKRGLINPDVIGGYKYIITNPIFDRNYKLQINSWLIKYYASQNEIDNVAAVLDILIKDDLSFQDGIGLMEIMINNKLYDEAFNLGRKYGFSGIRPARLLGLCNAMIAKFDMVANTWVDYVTTYLFTNRVYNENMLKYMIVNFNGTNEELYKLWKACKKFGLDVTLLSERTLSQMMFSRAHNGRLTEIFVDYYNTNGIKLLVKAYLAYNAFLYVVKGKKSNEVVYRVFEKCIEEKVGIADICYVAYLKDVARKPDVLQDEYRKKISRIALDYLCKKEIYLSFYDALSKYLILPYNIIGSTNFEYVASPDCKCFINYVINGGEEHTEIMKKTSFGLFTFKLNLFFGDEVKYYYIVDDGKNPYKTQENAMDFDDLMNSSNRGRYDELNDCFASAKLKDYMTLREVMSGYCVEKYVVDSTFSMRRD